jgi:hypothetical protein
MHRLAFVTLTAAVCLAGSAPATAEDPFVATFTVNGRTLSTGASSARVFAGLFTENGLSGLFGGYTAGVPVVARVSLRGLPGELSYPAGSAAASAADPIDGHRRDVPRRHPG